MSEEELTVFDIKYNEAIERFNSLFSSEEEKNINSIKNYIEKYNLEKSLEHRAEKKENNKNKNDEKRKQIVDLYEIRIHEKKTQQYYNKNYLKNEIEWYKIKQKEDEIKNKYNNNYNKIKYDNDIINKEISKEIIRNNKIKMKKFSNLANKVNIEKIKQQKKLNKNSIKDDLYQDDSIDNKDQGKFIPYNKYKEYNIQIRNRNKKDINKNKTNININKSETINNINNNKKIIKIENKINNHISQNIDNKMTNNKSIEKNKPLKSLDNKNIIIDKRKPLNEKIDYLKQFEKNKKENKIKIYENKKLNNKNNQSNNIDILNFHCKNYEDKAKRQEQLMRIRGKSTDRNADNVKLSNLLIDSISTKLAILNQMAQNT